MHDFHAAEALVDRLRNEHSDAELERVEQVRIRASAVFSPEALEQSYEMLTRGTALEASRLLIEELPSEHRCPHCGHTWRISRDDLAGHMLVCTACTELSSIETSAGIELLALSVRSETKGIETRQEELA